MIISVVLLMVATTYHCSAQPSIQRIDSPKIYSKGIEIEDHDALDSGCPASETSKFSEFWTQISQTRETAARLVEITASQGADEIATSIEEADSGDRARISMSQAELQLENSNVLAAVSLVIMPLLVRAKGK
jgi:hypothetical protein